MEIQTDKTVRDENYIFSNRFMVMIILIAAAILKGKMKQNTPRDHMNCISDLNMIWMKIFTKLIFFLLKYCFYLHITNNAARFKQYFHMNNL